MERQRYIVVIMIGTTPPREYFTELFRVSRNQIIWGANHFISRMPVDSSCWVVWDKGTGDNDFADAELAWTSFNCPVRKYFKSWVGANAKEKFDKQRIHPTQKPMELYGYLLQKFANPGDKILDTHLGSGSIALAVDRANKLDKKNLTFVGVELDNHYFNAAVNRFKLAHAQSCLSF
jgi:site-specific DNA-methyltransferase (adenine-specific)